jgi:hypothetical protein
VAAAVIGDDVEGTRESGQDGLPNAAVDPGPVHEDKWVTGAGALVIEPNSVGLKKGRELRLRRQSRSSPPP